MATYLEKIFDNRRIVVPAKGTLAPDGFLACSDDPYFQIKATSNAWTNIWRSFYFTPPTNDAEGITSLWNDLDAASQVLTLNTRVGFIVTCEVPVGTKLRIQTSDANYIDITTSGRWTGYLDQATTASSFFQAKRISSNSNSPTILKELLFFNANIYTYEDFLQSPNAILQYEQKNTRPEISLQYPRLGWADVAPSELVSGRWLGNQLYYSEQLQQTSNWKPSGLTVTANAATAPDGNNTADRLIAAGVGKMYQVNNFPSLASGPKCFSVWLKAVSGQVAVSMRLNNAGGTVVKETIYTVDTNWKRYFIEGSVTTTGCHAEIGFSSATGIDVWGAQVVDEDTPGAYTLTTTALLPAGTKPPGSTLPVEMPNSQAVIGDRLENVAWDGLFSTPIAWVCVGPGYPGTWKAVYLFDAWGASKDPYFYGTVGVGAFWEEQNYGGTATVVNNILTLSKGIGVGAAGIKQSVAYPAAVLYELVTGEIAIVPNSKLGNVKVELRTGNAANDIVFLDATVALGGLQAADKVISATPADGRLIVINEGTSAVASSIALSKALVRPKYPFLTKAPAGFAANLPVKAQGASDGAKNIWYANTSAVVSYAAGVITFTSGTIWQLVDSLPKGKTLRIRFNVTTSGGGVLFGVMSMGGGAGAYATIPTPAPGMYEATMVVGSADSYPKVFLQSTGEFSFNYLRVYAE